MGLKDSGFNATTHWNSNMILKYKNMRKIKKWTDFLNYQLEVSFLLHNLYIQP